MSERQLAMVMDLNKCIGCQTCTVACKTQWTNRDGREYMYWNNVETRPGQGYPARWEESAAASTPPAPCARARCRRSRPSTARPGTSTSTRRRSAPRWGRGRPRAPARTGTRTWGGRVPELLVLLPPADLNHCSNPACLAACPRGAIFKRASDGVVLVDQSRCEGQRYCVAACPYKKAFFNPRTFRSEKCILCFPRVEKGLAPACAHQCVGRIRWVGYLDDEAGQVHALVRRWQVALPLHPEYGTRPNVFYVPPLPGPPRFDATGKPVPGSHRIPLAELEKLFGPEVRRALATLEGELAKRKAGKTSELLDTLVAFRHAEMFRLDAPDGLVPLGRRGVKSAGPGGEVTMRVALAALLAAAAAPALAEAPAPPSDPLASSIIAARTVDGPLRADVAAPLWDGVPAARVPLAPQRTVRLADRRANAALSRPGPAAILVRAVTDGRELALLLEWPDATEDRAGPDETARFGDAVAVQLPLRFGAGVRLPYVGHGRRGPARRGPPPPRGGAGDHLPRRGGGRLRLAHPRRPRRPPGRAAPRRGPRGLARRAGPAPRRRAARLCAPASSRSPSRSGRATAPSAGEQVALRLEAAAARPVPRRPRLRRPSSAWGRRPGELGDVARGKQLVNGMCAGCHVAGERKVARPGIAPDLSDVGVIATPAYLRESILTPSAVIVPGPNPAAHQDRAAPPDGRGTVPPAEAFRWFRVDAAGKAISKMPPTPPCRSRTWRRWSPTS